MYAMAGFLLGLLNTDKWSIDAQTAFSEQEVAKGSGSLVSLKNIFKDLCIAYKNNLKLWWEIKSLENYISHSIVPKGLQVNIVPAVRSCPANLLVEPLFPI